MPPSKPIDMREYANGAFKEMEARLHAIENGDDLPVHKAAAAIRCIMFFLRGLNATIVTHEFTSEDSEIDFFRDVKPRFVACFLFWQKRYQIEAELPASYKKVSRNYYKKQLAKLKSAFDDNLDFYRYYRSGNTHLDRHYFTRGGAETLQYGEPSIIELDTRTSTLAGHKVAQLLANEMLGKYLGEKLDSLKYGTTSIIPQEHRLKKWTASKVALIELVYALHSEGVFNNGAMELKEVADLLSNAFGVDLGHYHKAFLEIRERKNDRTKFLNTLREGLILRMDDADGI
ncbi:MAG: tetracycline regulation of excision, RteC [Moraxellaceae bacterium]|nr:MAG: tetracycline regulation of excision, RteC [Moraxellaceae bacterium]